MVANAYAGTSGANPTGPQSLTKKTNPNLKPWDLRPGDTHTSTYVHNMPVGKNTTSTQVTLAPHQKALESWALPQAHRYAQEDISIHPDTELVAPFTAAQQRGQQMVLDAAGQQQDIVNKGAAASNFMLDPAALTAAGNPMEQAAIDAAVRPIYQNLTESELPQLRSGAAVSGGYGSSRQGIAEGLASGRASQAAGDTSAKIAESAYQSNLDAMTKALGLMPQTAGAMSLPGATTSAVGEVQQAQKQAVDEANLERQFYNENIPLTKAQNLTALAGGSPGGGTASTTPQQPFWQQLGQDIIGGATLGGSLFGLPGAAGGGTLGAAYALLNQ